MKLWLLKPAPNLPDDNNPWYPCEYKCHGMVLQEETELLARELASRGSCNEGCYVWLDSKLTTCIELIPTDEPGLIIQDIHSS
jgi:hypothetical protein